MHVCLTLAQFVIASLSSGESPHGPMVKQIMDHPRCAQLKEGDVIMEVNGEKVNTYLHSDVVTVLKRCSKGNQASFTVLRIPAHQEVREGGGYTTSSPLEQADSCI